MKIKFIYINSLTKCPETHKTANSICLTEVMLMEEMIEAIKSNTLMEFRKKYTGIKELTILGIDGLKHKKATAMTVREIVLQRKRMTRLYSFVEKKTLLADDEFPDTIKFLLR